MIKTDDGRKITPREAAIQTALTRLEKIGYTTDEREMIQDMTDAEFETFVNVYHRLFQHLYAKISSDEATLTTILDDSVMRENVK